MYQIVNNADRCIGHSVPFLFGFHFTVLFQAGFRQSYSGSIFITTQSIETQRMPNESSGQDLENRADHFYIMA